MPSELMSTIRPIAICAYPRTGNSRLGDRDGDGDGDGKGRRHGKRGKDGKHGKRGKHGKERVLFGAKNGRTRLGRLAVDIAASPSLDVPPYAPHHDRMA
jgi:hypothetical protein